MSRGIGEDLNTGMRFAKARSTNLPASYTCRHLPRAPPRLLLQNASSEARHLADFMAEFCDRISCTSSVGTEAAAQLQVTLYDFLQGWGPVSHVFR